jgi:NAD(P)-dependent dehydrogenase (short-subunit alcohol dehydrogenase family)
VRADVSDPTAVREAFASIQEKAGTIAALVNNAGILVETPLMQITVADWNSLMAVNAASALICTQAAYPLMRASGGSVINVSSVHALATSRGKGAYAASKAALVALTRGLALELADDAIRVNAVLPGAVDTGMVRDASGVVNPGLTSRTPLQRIGDPSEIAQVIYFLANGGSSFVTGQTIVVDGGALARLSTE